MLRLLLNLVVKIAAGVCLALLIVNSADARVKFHSTHGWNTGGKTGNKQERLGAADANFDAGTGTLTVGCYGLPFVTCWELEGNDIWVYGVIGTPGTAGTTDYCYTPGTVTVTFD